jgi:2-oxo-3-hexenedioate decarboxylase
MNARALADQLLKVRQAAALLPPLTTTQPSLTLAQAYEVADEIRRRRIEAGERPRGYKIGFTNRGIWPKYGVHAPIWAPVWDSTLTLLDGAEATLPLAGLVQPRLEPEIVFGFARSPHAGMSEAQLAACIEWVAHGVEIVHTHFDGWRFQAPDTVADFGLHGRLLVGPRTPIEAFDAPGADLARLSLQLLRDGIEVDRGKGSAVLDGPLNALRLWVDAMAAQPHHWPIKPGDVVTTGTLTDAWPLEPGQQWRTVLSDPCLSGLHLSVVA